MVGEERTRFSGDARGQTRARSRTSSLAAMRPSPLLLAVTLALPLLGCATDDGFRTRLAQGCRSERECAQLAAQADARAGACPSTSDPKVVLRVRLDLGSSAPPCDEVEADRRVAHGYLDGLTRERDRQAAWAKQQKAIRRREQRALRKEDRERQRADAEAEQRQREEREEREEAARAAADSAPRAMPTVPATPAPRDTGGPICCCDGTVSPTCTTVHRGCCSHHGGVCECD